MCHRRRRPAERPRHARASCNGIGTQGTSAESFYLRNVAMNSSRKRDESIERLLRQSMKAPDDTGGTDSCLDAETVAAMIDGGLPVAALNAARVHVADCG